MVHSYAAFTKTGGNPYIIDFCETLWIHILQLEYKFFKATNTLDESVLHHEAMITALGMKDTISAEIAMEKNWTMTSITLQNVIASGNI